MSKFTSRWFFAPLDTYQKTEGIVFQRTESHYTERKVNFESYSQELLKLYEELDAQGYDVVNVVPINMGQSESCNQSGGAYVGDVGFSITRGAVVVGKKKDEP